jgi:hypothetical protein
MQTMKTTKTNTTTQGKSVGVVGVLIPVFEELEALDEREQGYDRHLVPLEWVERVDDLLEKPQDIRSYEGTFLNSIHHDDYETKNETAVSVAAAAASATVWMYVPQVSQTATTEYPIPQSYVDICLRGCLDISQKFMEEFLQSTYGWNGNIQWQQQPSSLDEEEEKDNNDEEDAMTTMTTTTATMASSSSSLSSSSSYTPRHHRKSSSLSSVSSSHYLRGSPSSLSDDSDYFSFVEQGDIDEHYYGNDDDNILQTLVVEEPWVNDRRDPIYMRADREYSLQNAHTLDQLLANVMTKSTVLQHKPRKQIQSNSSSSSSSSSSYSLKPTPTTWSTAASLLTQWRVPRGKQELNKIRNRRQQGIKQ